MNFIRIHLRTITGTLAGAAAGYLYYHFIGCAGGSCPITSNPYISILYGAMLGFLVFHKYKRTSFKYPKTPEHENNKNHH